MRGLAMATLRYLSDVLIEVRSLFWSISVSKKHKLKILKGHSYWFTHFGDITKLLYIKQHLVGKEKSFEYDVLSLYKSLISKNDVILDIGANVGLFSLLGAELVGDKGKIYAFEPAKSTFKALVQNIALNKYDNIIENFELALSDKAGFVEMELPSTNSSFNEKDAFAFIKQSSNNNAIKSTTLDLFLKKFEIEKVDLVKVDIEGAELLLMKGSVNFLTNFKTTILFEGYEENCKRFNYSLIELLEYLRNFGFRIKQINSETWLATNKVDF